VVLVNIEERIDRRLACTGVPGDDYISSAISRHLHPLLHRRRHPGGLEGDANPRPLVSARTHSTRSCALVPVNGRAWSTPNSSATPSRLAFSVIMPPDTSMA
jgi:hypothetical protein